MRVIQSARQSARQSAGGSAQDLARDVSRDPATRKRAGSESRPAFPERQRQLLAAMKKLARVQRSTVDLATWALREVPFAMALVEDGAITFANARWNQMAKLTAGTRRWRRVDAGTADTAGSVEVLRRLNEVVFSCAKEALEGERGKEGVRVYEQLGSDQSIELAWSVAKNVRRVVITARLLDAAARPAAETSPEKQPAIWLAHEIRNDVSTVALVVSSLKAGGGLSAERLVELLDRAIKNLAVSTQTLESLLRNPKASRSPGSRSTATRSPGSAPGSAPGSRSPSEIARLRAPVRPTTLARS